MDEPKVQPHPGMTLHDAFSRARGELLVGMGQGLSAEYERVEEFINLAEAKANAILAATRAAALEEAAQVAESEHIGSPQQIAAAIRALKEK